MKIQDAKKSPKFAVCAPSHKFVWLYLRNDGTCRHLDPSSHLAATDTGRKLGGSAPLCGGGAGSPSNTVWPGPRPTCMPSFVLIRPTVWPQYTNATDRQDRTDNGPIAYGEPFYKRSPKNGSRAHCLIVCLSVTLAGAAGRFVEQRPANYNVILIFMALMYDIGVQM